MVPNALRLAAYIPGGGIYGAPVAGSLAFFYTRHRSREKRSGATRRSQLAAQLGAASPQPQPDRHLPGLLLLRLLLVPAGDLAARLSGHSTPFHYRRRRL